jgi:hypothetical protein
MKPLMEKTAMTGAPLNKTTIKTRQKSAEATKKSLMMHIMILVF